MSGLEGNDTLAGEQAVNGSGSPVPAPISLELFGGDGDDTLKGGSYDDTLDGSLGADFLKGNGGIDTSTYLKRTTRVRVDIAGAQDGTDADNDGVAEEGDTTTGDVENVVGGKGADLLIGSDSVNVLTGNAGADELRGLGAMDTLDAGPGADKLVGGLRNDVEHGGPDSDTFDQGAGLAHDGADELFGEAGSDTVDYSKRKMDLAVRLDGLANDGADTDHDGFGLEEADNVHPDIEKVLAGQGHDTLVGSDLANTLNGGSGADLLDGGLGPDLLDGSTGIDTASYEQRAADLVVTLDNSANDGDVASSEQDTVKSTVENVRGGSGNDRLFGSSFANQLEGGDGLDVLDGFAGPDAIFGGPGFADTVIFQASMGVPRTTSLWVTLDDLANDGTDLSLNGVSEEGDNVHSDVEAVEGGNAPDLLVGDGDPNALTGFAGDDSLDGQGGSDQLLGLDGNDDFFEGSAPSGADDIWGGPGDHDEVHYSARSMQVTVLLDDLGNDGDVAANEGDNVHADVEDAVGSSRGDGMSGSSSANHFIGGPGNDGLHGGDGPDALNGGADNDFLFGDGDDDVLRGGPGDDSEEGGPGQGDVMHEDPAANGADTFTDSGSDATVDYSARTVPLVIDVDGVADDGADLNGDGLADEGDNVDLSIYVISGGSASDSITGRSPHTTFPRPRLAGNGGNDVLMSGPDVLLQPFGVILDGGPGNDTLMGGANHDTLIGGPGDDTEAGGECADVFDEGGAPNGADDIRGGSGCITPDDNDLVLYSGRGGSVNVSLDDVNNDGAGGGSEGDNIHSDVGWLRGSQTGDVLSGNNLDSMIQGGPGQDHITGGAGNEHLFGDEDADVIDGGPGNDDIQGLADIDTLNGGPGNDSILGGDGADTMDGQADNDILDGEARSDLVRGGDGNDVVVGGAGTDSIYGNADNDLLSAQDGEADICDGGAGVDTGTFDSALDVLLNIP